MILDRTTFAPVAMFVVLAIALISVWLVAMRGIDRQIQRDTAITVEQIAIRLEAYIARRIAVVERIRLGWQRGELYDKATFTEDALITQEQNPGFQAINRIDAQGIIRWVTPEEGNRKALGINVREIAIFGPVFERAEQTGESQVTPPIDLVQGGKGFVVLFPLKRADRFDGSFTAVFRISDIVEQALRKGVRENYFYMVADGDTEMYRSGKVPASNPYLASDQFKVLDRIWTVTLMPTPERVGPERRLEQLMLVIGLLFSGALSWLFRLYLLRQDTLRKSEGQLKSILDNAPATIYLKDLDGRYRLVNKNFEERFHVTTDEVLGMFTHKLGPKHMANSITAHDAKVIESGLPIDMEEEWEESETLRIYAITKFPVRDSAGNIVGVGGIETDVTERKNAEETLRASNERFRAIVNHSPNAIYLKDAQGRYLLQNGQSQIMYGVSDAEILGKTIHDLVPPEIARQLAAQDKAVIETGAVIEENLEMARPDGSARVIRVTKFPILDADGNPIGIGGIDVDITELKQTEESLRKLSRVVEQGSASVIITDFDGNIEYVNPAFTKITGYTIDEVRGRNPRILQSGETPIETYQELWDTIKSGRVWTGELLNKSKNGRVFIELETISPVFNDDGAITNFVGILEDITERKQAEEALRDSEAQAKAIVDAATDAVITIDEKGLIIKINHAGEHMFGYSAEEAIGQNVSILMPEPDRSRHDGYLESYHKTGIAKIIGIGREVEAQCKDGSVFPVDLSISEVPITDGHIFTAFVRDITERKKAEEQLHQALKLEAIGQLTGGLAHDFNNLLAIIKGNIQLLEFDLEADKFQEFLGPVIRAVDRGADLTHRLLAFSRQQALKPQVIDIDKLSRGMVEMLRRTMGETIEIDVRREEGLWKTFADPGQVENALINLAINARDAMPKGGKLTIETRNTELTPDDMASDVGEQLGQYVVLQVSDTGTGMPGHVLERVFEPFFTTKEVSHGSGLGLSMIYGFVKQSGGHIMIESEEGHGTTIALYLPRAEGAEMVVRQESTDREVPRGNGEVILVVEDDPDVRELVVRQLEGLGYVAHEATDGSTALDTLSSASRIDLLLSDVVLPGGMSGIEIYARAGEDRTNLKCIFMSGYAETGDRPLPDRTRLLDKPVDYANLARTVRATLDARAT